MQILKHNMATIIVLLGGGIFLGAYPFSHTFWGGFLTHAAGAAFIGGLADWYAVTALFGKPLGISFKTAVIPKSQKRILEMARHMVEEELLTVTNMYRVVKETNCMQWLQEFLLSEEGDTLLDTIIKQLKRDGTGSLGSEPVLRILIHTAEKALAQARITTFLIEEIYRLLQRKESIIIYTFFI